MDKGTYKIMQTGENLYIVEFYGFGRGSTNTRRHYLDYAEAVKAADYWVKNGTLEGLDLAAE